ncbi:MAG: winged helix-turn-helix transcriptional regulator [Rhodospirillaceae bacterium]|nr:winged helix-turn-helix transcriptional regulator [Rhodospirillaceae bacterium]
MLAPKSKTSTPYALASQVGFILRRATQRHLTIFSERISDLTPTQFAALAMLNQLGPVSQNELGRRTAMDGATIKGVIDRLRKRDLVSSAPDPSDQRRIIVSLSPTGLDMVEGYINNAEAITADTLAPLSEKEQKTFLELLWKLT